MPDSPELQAARDQVALLERKDELTRKVAGLEQQLAAAREELAGLGKPPKAEPTPVAKQPAP